MKNYVDYGTAFENSNVWFVADTHFFHKKLVLSCPDKFDNCRIYNTVEEMNSDIIAKWNSVINKDDIVIFLGDFGLNIPYAQLKEEFNRLMFNELNSDNLCFVRGNHDRELMKRTKDYINWNDGIIFDYYGKHYICQHEDFDEQPISSFVLSQTMPNVLVHGHTHSANATSICKNLNMIQNCVSWEVAYKPINILDLKTANE